MPDEPLNKLRARIRQTVPTVGCLPYSHNIIRLILAEIDRRFGRAEANKAVRDFRLESKGFNQEPESNPDER